MGKARRNLAILGLLTFFLPNCSLEASERLRQALDIKPLVEELEVSEDVQETSEEPEKKYWTCPSCSDVENRVLRALQDEGITDKVALAVLLGNIKQESRFETTVCEGGRKTGYRGCYRGGFGLIQWTTASRYRGLGRVAREYQMDPDSLEAQLKWLFTEVEWKAVEGRFKTPGKSMSYYMDAAYDWLRWGKEGRRVSYSKQYEGSLQM